MATLSSVGADLRGHVDRLVGPIAPAAPFGTYVVASADPAAALGRHLELQVFGDVFGNSEELLAAEYGPYEASSIFLLVVDHRRRLPAGVMRLVVPSPAGLKSLTDIHRVWGGVWGADPDDLVRSTGFTPGECVIWDMATLAVGRDYRNATTRGVVSLALWQAVGVMAYRCGVDLLVAVIDVPVYRLLQVKLRQAFATFELDRGDAGVADPDARFAAEPMPYLDSPASLPVWCRPDRWRARFRDADPELYRVMIDGVGLEAAVVPPDWDDAAATALLSSAVPPDRR